MVRKIVLCFDETETPYHGNSSNVLKMSQLLKKNGHFEQRLYYEAGIGSRFVPPCPLTQRTITRTIWGVRRILDNAFGVYLDHHLMGGYEFLVKNYSPGTKLFIFGVSCGAYTARALAAMLHKVGLVSRDHEDLEMRMEMAHKLYVSTSPGNEGVASDFKKDHCCAVPIDFLGVWDTVPSVGILKSRTLPFVDADIPIRVFRQALSLDECRANFCPNLYRHNGQLQGTENDFKTDVREVWFAGTHTDVGGGSVPKTAQHDLADISLRWMVEQLVRSRCQIAFNYDKFARLKVPTTIGQDTSTSEDVNALNAEDALQPIADNLSKNRLWWILEVLPMWYSFQNTEGKWVTMFGPHFGRGRQLPPGALFHTSVERCMEDPNLKYKPRAWYEHGMEMYVP